MMAQKDRSLAALPPANLEDLVPTDHFYRHLERTLDLSFVREVVRDAYADIGRPSIDPVIFFKLQLVMFSEGTSSERRLMEDTFQRHCGRAHHVTRVLGEQFADPHSVLARPLPLRRVCRHALV
jgi:hypothetical protein